MMRSGILLAVLALTACGRGDSRGATDSARGEVAAADTGMAGMDHSKMAGMGGTTSTAADSGMAGMDHSKMPGMGATKAGGTGTMAGMDHSKMPGMTTTKGSAGGGAMAGMDHSKMPGMGATKAAAGNMAGMDHSRMAMPTSPAASRRASTPAMDHATMPGMNMPSGDARRRTTAAPMDHASMPGMTTAPVSAADVKLDQLLAGLLRDTIVRARIQTDTALKRRWDEAARRTLLLTDPQ